MRINEAAGIADLFEVSLGDFLLGALVDLAHELLRRESMAAWRCRKDAMIELEVPADADEA